MRLEVREGQKFEGHQHSGGLQDQEHGWAHQRT